MFKEGDWLPLELLLVELVDVLVPVFWLVVDWDDDGGVALRGPFGLNIYCFYYYFK